jgi:hypothetical protein
MALLADGGKGEVWRGLNSDGNKKGCSLFLLFFKI